MYKVDVMKSAGGGGYFLIRGYKGCALDEVAF